MKTLTIRNLPLETHDALRRQAAENRRSVEAEARAVIAQGVKSTKPLDPSVTARLRGALPKAPGGARSFLAERRVQGALEQGGISHARAADLLEALDAGTPADEVLARLEALSA